MAASFFSKLSSFEKQLLIYGVGGYTVWSAGMAIRGDPAKRHNHEESECDGKNVKDAAASSSRNGSTQVVEQLNNVTTNSISKVSNESVIELTGPNDPMVLFALNDIQSRLTVIEKALRL